LDLHVKLRADLPFHVDDTICVRTRALMLAARDEIKPPVTSRCTHSSIERRRNGGLSA
jgi:hypothetical protein